MAEHYSFFDAVLQDDGTYDREYNAQQFTKYFGALVTTGIMKGSGNMLAVSANGSNMVTKINTGIAFVEAKYYENDSFKELTHDTETLGNSRIDRIVIRMDLSTEARYVKAFVKKGTPSTNPVAPSLTQTANLYEISLAQVKVVGGQTFISTNAVTDERGKDVICPWAGSNILPNFDNNALQELMDRFMGSNLADLGITDLNDLKESGTYFYDKPIANKPEGSLLQIGGVNIGEIIVVYTGPTGVVYQHVYKIANSNKRKPIESLRGYYNGVWGPWYTNIDSNTVRPSYINVYVNSATGHVDNDGSKDKPYPTLQHALSFLPPFGGHTYRINVEAPYNTNETVQVFTLFGGSIEIIGTGGQVYIGFLDIMYVDRFQMKNVSSLHPMGISITDCPNFDITNYTNTASNNGSQGSEAGIEVVRSKGVATDVLISYKNRVGGMAWNVRENSNVLLKNCQGGSNTIGISCDGSVVRRGTGTNVGATTPTRILNGGQIL